MDKEVESEDGFAGDKSWLLSNLDNQGNELWTVSDASSAGGIWYAEDIFHIDIDPFSDEIVITGYDNVWDDSNGIYLEFNTYFNRYDTSGVLMLSKNHDVNLNWNNIVHFTKAFYDSTQMVSEYIMVAEQRLQKFDKTGNVIWSNDYSAPFDNAIAITKISNHYYVLGEYSNMCYYWH